MSETMDDSGFEFECIDIGANLTSKEFKEDLDEVLLDARSCGVTRIVLTGSSERNSLESARLAEENPGFLYATAGIHPHDASHFESEKTSTFLRELYQHESVVSVGECGLDYNRDFSPRDAQRSCFMGHLDLAAETGLPLFLHERDAFEDFYDLMKTHRDRVKGGVVHCFTGTREQAKAYLDLDLHLGITGWICDERRGRHLRDVVKHIPVSRLMIETDCPYLAPRDLRPKIRRNEPKHLPHILKTVAECRNEEPRKLAAETFATTLEFFQIA